MPTEKAGISMAVIDILSSTSPEAKHYRDRAAGARRDAAMAKGGARVSYLMIADQWELLATGVESFIRSGKRD
jgi:hypothetical protein